ncbi:hypothetical protein IMCC26134_11535 [Verrucomicrobia bacterium IMCC26134]|nr:hypothetical protein IMCC26134_11535 [Verrucomicrobia bacterium IMCC26134]
MLVPWQLILIGLALGLIPPRLFYGSGYRHGTLMDATNPEYLRTSSDSGSGRKRRLWWKVPLFWIDPIRGYFSAHFVALGLYQMPMDYTEQIVTILGIQCIATFVILVVQMEFGRQRSRKLLAPVAFLVGYLIGGRIGLELLGAAVAFLGLSTAITSRNIKTGLCATSAAAIGLGWIFLGATANLGIFAVTALAPIPYAFFRKASLVIPMRS